MWWIDDLPFQNKCIAVQYPFLKAKIWKFAVNCNVKSSSISNIQNVIFLLMNKLFLWIKESFTNKNIFSNFRMCSSTPALVLCLFVCLSVCLKTEFLTDWSLFHLCCLLYTMLGVVWVAPKILETAQNPNSSFPSIWLWARTWDLDSGLSGLYTCIPCIFTS